jgi:Tfp pilus assembly protein PilF
VALEQIRLARQFEKEGKIEEAIQRYRTALSVDSDNPVALNNIAWVLATASKPGLRDGKEAVRLAIRAVELTERRQPVVMQTLAAAYAEDGQFAKAVALSQSAYELARLTGQSDVANRVAELLRLYAAGKAVHPLGGP